MLQKHSRKFMYLASVNSLLYSYNLNKKIAIDVLHKYPAKCGVPKFSLRNWNSSELSHHSVAINFFYICTFLENLNSRSKILVISPPFIRCAISWHLWITPFYLVPQASVSILIVMRVFIWMPQIWNLHIKASVSNYAL